MQDPVWAGAEEGFVATKWTLQKLVESLYGFGDSPAMSEGARRIQQELIPELLRIMGDTFEHREEEFNNPHMEDRYA